MTELTKVNPVIIKTYESKGLNPDDIKIVAKLDMNKGNVRCDNWIFATDSEIICIGGVPAVRDEKHFDPSMPPKIYEGFAEVSYDCFSLEDYSDFKIDELISSCRLVARDKSGDYQLISMLSYTSRNDAYLFIKYLEKLLKGEDITLEQEDKQKELFCPKCGSRYADPDRKICPNCLDRGKLFKRTAVFFMRYKSKVIMSIIMILISNVFAIFTPYISTSFYYDKVLEEGGAFYGQLFLVIGLVVGTRILSGINSAIYGRFGADISNFVIYDIRTIIFNSIQKLSLGYFTNRQTGGLMNQVQGDAESLYWFFVYGLPNVFLYAVQTVCIIIVMLNMNWLLTIVSCVTLPLVFILLRLIYKRIRYFRAKQFGNARKMRSVLADTFNGVRVVKAFAKEKDETNRFGKTVDDLCVSNENISVFVNKAYPAAYMIFFLGIMAVWGIGGWMVIKGEMNMTYGILAAFVSYLGMLQGCVNYFSTMLDQISNSFNAMGRLCEVMDAIPDVVEKENPVRIEDMKGNVEFNNVSFSYEKNHKVIDGVSFTVEANKMLGIVGHSGAGKSTLANLLLRLYDVEEGEIKIDGVNVKDMAFEDIRKNIAIVSQETYLFSGTVYENIKYATPNATKEDVINAAKIAGAHDFIMRLPMGYLTKIGAGRRALSGGERQRISIARAILCNPKILIMDEATAAMDTQTERRIQNALEKLIKGRTTIVIAHRLSTLRDADKLIVIEDGKMPESGTHLELIQKKGIYYNLYKLQMDALKNAGIEE